MIDATCCTWCGSDTLCDCRDRMFCSVRGAPGHWLCGRQPCGCPNFWPDSHVCPSKGNVISLDAYVIRRKRRLL